MNKYNIFALTAAVALVLLTVIFLSFGFSTEKAQAQTPALSLVGDVYIRGEISQNTAFSVDELIRRLNDLGASEIKVHITSPGGSVYAGLQIYDSMSSSNAKIRTICEGYCMSMAAFLLAAGDIREAYPSASIMFHQVASETHGHIFEMKADIAEAERLQGVMDEITHKHTGLSLSAIQKMESYDHYMDPKEALSLGIIDKIIVKK